MEIAMTEKPMHPADAAQLALISRASSFTASLFLGKGKYAKREAETLSEARTEALRIAGVHGAPGQRTPMIFAVLPDGRDVLVPDDYEPGDAKQPETKEQTMTTTKPAAKTTAKAPASTAKTKASSKKPPAPKAAAKTVTAKKPTAEQKANKQQKHALGPVNTKAALKLGKRAAIEAAAREGKLPAAPDFSAATHERFRPRLAEVVKLAKAGDVKGLKAFEINATSTSPKAIARYRDLCVIAIEAKTAA
jgi:hypothetical protein